jgi:S-DNA-T family DNA segregation ATPase FtsK/SpoIIIE
VSTTHDDTDDPRGELAQVHYLPTTATNDESAPIEGEIITDEEYQRLTSQKAQALARYQAYRNDLVVTGRVVRTVATHHHTTTVAKTVARHALYVPAGAAIFGKRAWESRTTARYERQMRAAEAIGNWERLDEWEQRAEQFKERRHRRAMDWIEAPAKLAKALVIGALSLVGVLTGLGIVLMAANKDVAAFLDPFTAALSFLRWVVLVVTVVWGPLVLAAPWVGVLALWNEGRKRTTLPGWLASAAGGRDDIVIDERAIAHALANLGLGPLTRYFKEGGQLRYTKMPARDGVGVACQLRLPAGVAAADIIENKDRRKRMAGAFQRAMIEV